MEKKGAILEFGRYGMVSVAALSLDFGVLALLTSVFGIHYLISSAISYICGLVLSYVLSVTWVFRSRRVQNKSVEFAGFVAIGIVGLGINQVLMWLFTSVLGLFYPISRAFSAVIGYLWKYFARKLMLFRNA